jgi:hypothetical protein
MPAGDCDLDAAIAKDGSRKRANNVTSPTSADASIENMPLAGLETPTKLQKIRRGRHLSVPSSGRKPTNFEAEDQDKPLAVPAAVLAIPHQAAEEEIHPDDEDRASIVVRCTSEAGYTSEDQAKVLALMSGYRARHATSDIVTDYDRDKMSCSRCQLNRIGIKRNGKKFMRSPCPEEYSIPKRATLITGFSRIQTREEAIKRRWYLQRLAKPEHGKAIQSE